MKFLRYPHLCKFGHLEVQNIEFGITHIFPKLDGTNASIWNKNNQIAAGSRNRELSTNSDNAHFFSTILFRDGHLEYILKHPTHILYGEWLVPHTIKNYRQEAWNRFWIFDVYDRSTNKFLPYDVYKPLLEEFSLDVIPCIKSFKNGSWENFLHEAKNNAGFLLPDGEIGEGIVIKNYDWVNSHQQVTWAKIVLAEFKDKFHTAMGHDTQENISHAATIVAKACTVSLIEKEYAKIVLSEGKWENKLIPRLLHTVFHSVVTEELWDCLKIIKYGLVNFKELQQLCILKVKETKPELF